MILLFTSPVIFLGACELSIFTTLLKISIFQEVRQPYWVYGSY